MTLDYKTSDLEELFLIAKKLFLNKHYIESIFVFDKINMIDESIPSVHLNRGLALRNLSRLDEALISFDNALALKPDFAEAHNNRGNLLKVMNQPEEALKSFEKAIIFKTNFFEAYYNRGITQQHLNRLEDALISYDIAIKIKPNFAEAYNNRGNVLRNMRRHDEALESFESAIENETRFAEAYNNKGAILQEINKLEEALLCFNTAISINSDYAEAYNNRGTALQKFNLHKDALLSYDKAIALKPDYAEAYWNKSLLHILNGQYHEGWELYEWRLQKDETKDSYYKFQLPKLSWRGQESIEGKRIFIHSEQGFGDVIQFCRYLPQVRYLGAEVILEVPKPLVSFVSTLNCNMTVIGKGDPHPEFDTYCPIMSLPYAFKTTLETIPADTPYLYAKNEKIQNWHEKLGNKDRLRVGLVWSGSTGHKNDINRSIPFEKFLPLFNLPIELHSLHKEYRTEDLNLLHEHPEIHRHQDELEDFSDTAALIECMDLVISVDTSVAHVAGAIGKPVWILLPYAPDYRWMLDREDSPWYPTAKLYRQPHFDDWQSVIQSVRKSVTELLVRNSISN